jgi:hypothetical protein
MEDYTSRMATLGVASDPTKHVNYTYGMVLGVDDLTQEFAYHSGRDQWTARDTIGYGTVNGLRVTIAPNANGETEVNVSAGTALSPRGQLIHVPAAQCANLVKWLAIEKNRKAVGAEVGVPPAPPLTLSVVLCYRSCPTDKVPVPGEPCRSEEDSMAYSRLRDDFKLELRIKSSNAPVSPEQREEDALRDFIRWLNEHLVVTEEDDNLTNETDFINTILQAAYPAAASPPLGSPPDFMIDDSPPGQMRVRADQAGDFMRIAFRLWTTELRPRWRPAQFNTQSTSCPPDGADTGMIADDNCVLLADLRVPLTNQGLLDTTQQVRVLEERRPYLIHLRMLQEWLMYGTFDEVVKNPAKSEIAQVLPFVSMFRHPADASIIRMWFQLDAPDNHVELLSLGPEQVLAFGEHNVTPAPDFLEPLTVTAAPLTTDARNFFDVTVSIAYPLIRFVFLPSEMKVRVDGTEEMSLLEFAQKRNIKYVGQDAGKTITAFAPMYIPIK